jgi:uncharacterized cupin superfamily protein
MTTTHRSRTGTYPEEGIKAPCVVAAIANVTLSGEQTVNSVACVAGDRVLTTAQTDTTENGIWLCAVGAWERPTDWSDANDVASGITIPVATGTIYQATFTGSFVAGTTSVTIAELMATANGLTPNTSYHIITVGNTDSGTHGSAFNKTRVYVNGVRLYDGDWTEVGDHIVLASAVTGSQAEVIVETFN